MEMSARRLVMKSFYHWKCSMQMYRIISLRSHFSLFVSLFLFCIFFQGFYTPSWLFCVYAFFASQLFCFYLIDLCLLVCDFFLFPSHFPFLVFSLIFPCFFVALCPSTVQFVYVLPSTVCRWIGAFRHCCGQTGQADLVEARDKERVTPV